MIALIAALGSDRLIGVDGAIPWRLPADLRRFRRRTLHKPILMGRATFESIGRPLPKRRNLVLSRQPGYAPEGVEVFSTLEAALVAASETKSESQEVMIIGGAAVYQAALPLAQRLYLTWVPGAFEGQDRRYFPKLGSGWRVVERADFATDAQNQAHTELVLERGTGSWPEALAGWR